MLLRGQRLDTFGWVICKCQSRAAIREKGALQRLNSKCVWAQTGARLPASLRPRPLRFAWAALGPPGAPSRTCQPPSPLPVPFSSPRRASWGRPRLQGDVGRAQFQCLDGHVSLLTCQVGMGEPVLPPPNRVLRSVSTRPCARCCFGLRGLSREQGNTRVPTERSSWERKEDREQTNRKHCRGWRVPHGGREGLRVRPHRTTGPADTRVSDCSTRRSHEAGDGWAKVGRGRVGLSPRKAALGAAPPAWALVTSAPRVLTGRDSTWRCP